jgi:hypothetical protein
MTPQTAIPDAPTEMEQPAQTAQPITGTELAAPGTAAAEQTAPPIASAPPAGTIRVALLLPLSASGATGNAAQSLKNAADMAMAEFFADKQTLPRWAADAALIALHGATADNILVK